MNEEMIETLFVVNTSNSKETTPRTVLPPPNQEIGVLDPKKSQNIAIALRALNVTIEEVRDALLEGMVKISWHHAKGFASFILLEEIKCMLDLTGMLRVSWMSDDLALF